MKTVKVYLVILCLNLMSLNSLAEPLTLEQAHRKATGPFVEITTKKLEHLASENNASKIILKANSILNDASLDPYTQEYLLEKSIGYISFLPETIESNEWLTTMTTFQGNAKLIHYEGQHKIISSAFSVNMQAQLILDKWLVENLVQDYSQTMTNNPKQFIKQYASNELSKNIGSAIKLKAAKLALNKLSVTQTLNLSNLLAIEQQRPPFQALIFHHAMLKHDIDLMLEMLAKMSNKEALASLQSLDKNDSGHLPLYLELTNHTYLSSYAYHLVAKHAEKSPFVINFLLDRMDTRMDGGAIAASLSSIPLLSFSTKLRKRLSESTDPLLTKRLLLSLKLHPDPFAQSELQSLLNSNLVSEQIKQELSVWKK